MTGQQRAVLWIGLIMVGLNLVTYWPTIKQVIFQGTGITGGITGGSSSSGGGLQFPQLPLPGMPLPGLLTQPTKKSNVTIM